LKGVQTVNNVNVFRYTDVLQYISDSQKAKLYPWTESYRSIARELGTGGPYFWLVVHGKKPFPRKIIEGLSGMVPLNKRESIYFQMLMHLSNMDMDSRFKMLVLDKFRPAQFKGKTTILKGPRKKK
jgi:hypothetical protein